MGLRKWPRMDRRQKFLERLEARQLFSVVSVTPQNFQSAIKASNPGDTISFAPGIYTLQTNPTAAAATWPGGRSYQGNGATLALSGGRDTSGTQAIFQIYGSSAVTEFTGFTCTDAPVDFVNGVFNVHGNTFQNTELGVFVSGNSGHIDGNTFAGNIAEGIYGYPGDNGTYNNNTITNATDDAIHLAATPGNNTTLSGNVITGCQRFGMEVQLTGSNISITNNYVSIIEPPPPGSWGAFSITCGDANGVTFTGNTGVSDRTNSGCLVEIMGYNANVSNNVSWGMAEAILNGAQGSSLQASGNTVYGSPLALNDSVPWANVPIVGSNTLLPLSAMPNPPASPSSPAPAPAAPAPTPSAPAAPPTTTPATTTSSGSAGLNGTLATAASSYNLSALGTSDWATWGQGNVATNFDHSATGGSQISNVTKVGSGSYGSWYDPSRSVSWTGGAPLASYNGDNAYIWANNSIGAGYSFTVPADTTARTLYVYAGGYSSGATLTAHLSDGSSADFVATSSGNGNYSNLYTINYKAASAGQTLTVSYTKTTNINGSSGSVDLIAAALAGGTASAPVATPANTSSGGLLNGAQGAPASSYNLTSLGTTDWAHWGTGNNASAFSHDAGGGSQISNVTKVGSGSYGSYYDPSRSVNWSNGSPQTSDSGDSAYIWANNALGAGYSFTVPASTTQHTLYVYAGGFSSGGTLTAHLSDGSAADFVATPSGNAIYTYLYTINFKAASAGQTLTISYVKSANINGSGGSVDLIAAALV
jgi:Right handed beta helix region